MNDMPVIYEDPKHPLPAYARYEAVDENGNWALFGEKSSCPSAYRTTLHYIVRLREKAYYVPENPHTTPEGFLPHYGKKMPEWVHGNRVKVKVRCGDLVEMRSYKLTWKWTHVRGVGREIVAYKIVGEQEECCDQPEQCWEPCGDLGKSEEHAQVVGLEDRYRVTKLSNPDKALDCIVLEFDDPIARKGIEAWADALCAEYPEKDYGLLASQVYAKLISYGHHFVSDDPIVDPRLVNQDELKQEAERLFEERKRKESGPRTGGVQFPPGYTRPEPTRTERHHRNELAARTLTPVPGMDDFMYDVVREARRHDYAKSVLAETIATEITDKAVERTTIIADAMIEREDSE